MANNFHARDELHALYNAFQECKKTKKRTEVKTCRGIVIFKWVSKDLISVEIIK